MIISLRPLNYHQRKRLRNISVVIAIVLLSLVIASFMAYCAVTAQQFYFIHEHNTYFSKSDLLFQYYGKPRPARP